MEAQPCPSNIRRRASASRGSAARFDYDLLTFRRRCCKGSRCARKTVKQSYRRWGLRPVRIAGKVLFPSDQLIELEHAAHQARRSFVNPTATADRQPSSGLDVLGNSIDTANSRLTASAASTGGALCVIEPLKLVVVGIVANNNQHKFFAPCSAVRACTFTTSAAARCGDCQPAHL